MSIFKTNFDNSVSKREEKNRKIAYEAAVESIVLLENNGVLPISAREIALFGNGAAVTVKGGTGSGEVNERYSVSICDGLENRGFKVLTKPYLNELRTEYESGKKAHNKGLLKKIITGSAEERINIMANQYRIPFGCLIQEDEMPSVDTCIYAIARQSGECADRDLSKFDYSLSDVEKENLRLCAASFKNLIVVINVGGSFDMGFVEDIEGIDAVIFMCQQGIEGGNALADLITGARSFSGCLASTWANKYDDLPFVNAGSESAYDSDYIEGIYVGYRYFDSFQVAPRYAFGYGKTYSEFEISCNQIEASGSYIKVNASVKNIGNYSGKKTCELYVSPPSGRLNREYQMLVDFGKTEVLKPGECGSVELSFDMKDIAAYVEKEASFILEKGDYVVRLGESSRDSGRVGTVRLECDIVTEKCRNIAPLKREIREIKPKRACDIEIIEPIIEMGREAFTPIIHEYDEKSEISKEALKIYDSLTHEERLKLLIGTGVLGGNPMYAASGAAGYTASFHDKGIRNLVMADGPAGLRLAPVSGVNKKGNVKPLKMMMDFMDYLPGIVLKFMKANPKKDKLTYQYATAFPVGMAMAQTFNKDLVKEVGDAVGDEMQEFGVTTWLAPGMNIQRNPLCGRNYEYFSEDPFLTGEMAAALTEGVGDKGCVTLKHFCANNREENRCKMSSNMSERTLREIYLKAFRRAVRAGAGAVMTSYNKVNGTYVCNSKELCTDVLRGEWGFTGFVMTDWMSTEKGLAEVGAAFAAGNDLIMPGGKSALKRAMKDFKDGKFSEEDLKRCCVNVIGGTLR